MAIQVVNGAKLVCTFGTGPSMLVVSPEKRTSASVQPNATIMDFVGMKNILPFVMCTAPTNPQVAAATSAAMGVLTPQPCIPMTTPWKPGATNTLIGGIPALDNTHTCQCTWGGVVTVRDPGQTSKIIP